MQDSLWEIVRSEIRRQGLSQETLARVSGVSQSTLSRLLGGSTSVPRRATLLRLAEALGIVPVNNPPGIAFNHGAVRAALEHHLQVLFNWSKFVSFRDLFRQRSLPELFVDGPVTIGSEKITISTLFKRSENLVLLGEPGSGKTTCLKFFVSQVLTSGPNTALPLLIRLRDLSGGRTVTAALMEVLGQSQLESHGQEYSLRAYLVDYLGQLGATLLIDGLDEIEQSSRASIVEEIRYYLLHAIRYRVLVACRTSAFRLDVENATSVVIAPFEREHVLDFSAKWLGPEKGSQFSTAILSQPYFGLECRPLILAHLCALFERSGIPSKPRSFYRKVLVLFLEEWDEQRSIARRSTFSRLDLIAREQLLESLAYQLSRLAPEKSTFSSDEMEHAYRHVCEQFSLPRTEGLKILREICTDSGLLQELQSSSFAFLHSSLQEFLAASHVVKHPWPTELALNANTFAVAVSLSPFPERFLTVGLRNLRRENNSFDYPFVTSLFERLLTERVDWPISQSLGVLILAMMTRCSMNPAGSYEQAILRFLKLPAAREAIALTTSLLNWEVLPGGEARCRVPADLYLPAELFKYVVGDESGTLMLSPFWSRLARDDPPQSG